MNAFWWVVVAFVFVVNVSCFLLLLSHSKRIKGRKGCKHLYSPVGVEFVGGTGMVRWKCINCPATYLDRHHSGFTWK